MFSKLHFVSHYLRHKSGVVLDIVPWPHNRETLYLEARTWRKEEISNVDVLVSLSH